MKIINRTPHPISIIPSGAASDVPAFTLPAAPRGEIARVESSDVVMRRGVRVQTEDEDRVVAVDAPLVHIDGDGKVVHVPVVATRWGRVLGLPDPDPCMAHVVSVIVAAAAHAAGRDLDDLYVPGGQVRDASGRIVGCSSLCRARDSLPGEMLAWDAQAHAERMRIVADLLSYPDDPAVVEAEQIPATRRLGGWPMQVHYIVRHPLKPHGGGYVQVTQEWGTNAWHWCDITEEQAREQYYVSDVDRSRVFAAQAAMT